MTEFGPNGSVLKDTEKAPYAGEPTYAMSSKPKLKRVGLAIFFCGLAASISVAIIGALSLFLLSLFGVSTNAIGSSGGLIDGFMFAMIAAALNWFVFYISIPAAWLALGFSIGRFPGRGITDRAVYYRWGSIWGIILVAGTAAIFSGLVSSNLMAGLGGLIGGTIIGALAGLFCAWLFLIIVRPAQQITRSTVDVF